jgi:HAD superfamily hydrolase (TIGR01509 family)
MIKTILLDFSRVLLFPKDKEYKGGLNALHRALLEKNPNYPFKDYFELNEELFAFLERVKNRFSLYIFTTGSIQNAKEIKGRLDAFFDGIFSAEEMGVSKGDPQTYIMVARKLGKNPHQVFLIDDKQTNIQTASQAGLAVFQYTDNISLIHKINQLLSE